MAKHTTRQRSNSHKTFSENQKLRRENSRLKKEIQRLNGALNNMTDSEFDVQEEVFTSIEKQKNSCPKCGDGVVEEVELGKYVYLFCSACRHRERKSS